MGLREQLDADMKAAMRAKETMKLSTIRMIRSAIQYKENEPGAKGPLDDTGILQVLGSEIKKRRDSADEYTKAGRPELAEKEEREIEVLQAYLPEPLSDAEVAQLIDEAIASEGAQGPRDMGKVMKALGPKTQGRVDTKQMAELVKQKLSG
jgi:uncharacterized protein YqeY